MMMKTRGIEHVALTVPDVEAATRFFVQAFGAVPLFDGHTPEDPPVEGRDAERIFGMPPGGKFVFRRLLDLDGSYLELFQYENTPHQRPPHTYDFGISHFAVFVDNLQEAANAVAQAGGRVYQAQDPATGHAASVRSSQGWVYVETPWGSVIELVTFPTM
jgi:catechol 2,3-dioxygenase-like lactoylglutathione lyase family enzyme